MSSVRYQQLKVFDERIDLAQIFSPSLFRFQFPLPDVDHQVADFAETLARKFFGRLERTEGGAALREINFEPGGVGADCRAQIPLEFPQLEIQNGDGRSVGGAGARRSFLFDDRSCNSRPRRFSGRSPNGYARKLRLPRRASPRTARRRLRIRR